MFRTQLWNTGIDTDFSRWDDFLKGYLSTLGSSDVSTSEVKKAPPVNIWTNDLGAKVTVKLPGYTEDEIDISVLCDTVTLKGGHKAEKEQTDQFERTIELPFSIEAANVSALYAKGILTITLPIAESQKPRKISVN
jgi:HSP20 family protein